VRAGPVPDIQTHRVADVSAGGACLAGREPAVRPDKRFPLAPALVFDEADELAPSGVGDCLGQSGVLHHAPDMRLFHDDDLVLIDKAPGQLVQVVASSVGDALMSAGDKAARPGPAVGAFHLARQLALQVAFRRLEVARVGELRSVAGHRQIEQTHVDPDGLALHADGRHGQSGVGQEGGMELTAGVAADSHRPDPAEDCAVNDALHPANLRQVDAVTLQLDPLGILDRLAAVLGLEARTPGAPGEETIEGQGQVLKRLLKDLAVRLLQSLELLLQPGQADSQSVVAQAFAGFPVGLLRQGRSIVEHPARAPELNSKLLLLVRRWIEPDADCLQYSVRHSRALSTDQCRALYPLPEGGFNELMSDFI
jgi:hypothetical protein